MKIRYLSMILLLFVPLMSCGINKTNHNPYDAPPLPTVTIGDKQVTVVRGSSCWSSNGTGQCVDKVSPKAGLKDIQPTLAAAGSKLRIDFDYKPIETDISLLSNKTEPLKLEPTNATGVPTEKGIYMYRIFAKWKEGTSDFVFTVEVKS